MAVGEKARYQNYVGKSQSRTYTIRRDFSRTASCLKHYIAERETPVKVNGAIQPPSNINNRKERGTATSSRTQTKDCRFSTWTKSRNRPAHLSHQSGICLPCYSHTNSFAFGGILMTAAQQRSDRIIYFQTRTCFSNYRGR